MKMILRATIGVYRAMCKEEIGPSPYGHANARYTV
jgi:hypothetical protein